MGIAASQARYLYLTARQTNVEFEGQQINQARTGLANEQAGLFNEMLKLEAPTAPSSYQISQQCQSWASAEPQGPHAEDYPGGETDPQYLKDMDIWTTYVESGYEPNAAYNTALVQYNSDNQAYEQELEEINAKSEEIHQRDQVLELQLRQLDTEQETIVNELESVKKVLDKNIENVFKTFQS